MRTFLVFQLYGPLCSWGDIAVGGERPAAAHPGRSAVLGLLAAAAGIRRHEEEQHQALEQAFGMAVRMESSGTFLNDYHTAQVPPQAACKKHPTVTRRDELLALAAYQQDNPKTSGTILSNRAYRCDALYQVALWQRQEGSLIALTLEQAKAYLASPNFTLYLGRKSCPPALPLQAQLIDAENLVAAFSKANLTSPQEFAQILRGESSRAQGGRIKNLFRKQPVTLFWDNDGEQGVESGVPAQETFVRRDAVLSRKRWQFEERQEHHAPWPQEPPPQQEGS